MKQESEKSQLEIYKVYFNIKYFESTSTMYKASADSTIKEFLDIIIKDRNKRLTTQLVFEFGNDYENYILKVADENGTVDDEMPNPGMNTKLKNIGHSFVLNGIGKYEGRSIETLNFTSPRKGRGLVFLM